MKLLKAVQNWLIEYRPDWKLNRIHGSNDIISVIMSNCGKAETIGFKFVDGELGIDISEFSQEQYVR